MARQKPATVQQRKSSTTNEAHDEISNGPDTIEKRTATNEISNEITNEKKDGTAEAQIVAEEIEASNDEEWEDDEEDDSGDDDDDDDDEIDERASLPAAELLSLGKECMAARNFSEAVTLFELAVRKRVEELDNDEVRPELAEYWLEYGNSLFSKDEVSGDIFGGAEKKGDDADEEEKEAAFECMDLARICYKRKLRFHLETKQLRAFTPGGAVSTEADSEEAEAGVLESLYNRNMADPSYPWVPTRCSEDPDIVKDVKKATYTRVRLGDFHQAMQQFSEAAEDFEAALVLCAKYRRPFSEGLTPSVPLAHCRLAMDDELTEVSFKLCKALIDRELGDVEAPQSDRKKMLVSSGADLSEQLQEYLKDRQNMAETVKDALKTICEEISTGQKRDRPEEALPEDLATAEPTDLGAVGKKKARKDSK